VLAAILLALAGVSSALRLPVDLLPDLNYPLINIITHDPAGTARDVEQLITRPIENSMLGLTNLQRVRSVSAPGFSQVTVEFNWGVDVIQARQSVASRLVQAQTSLPNGVRPQIENIGTSLSMVSTYGLSGGDPLALSSWARYDLAPRLETLPGVAMVQVMGGGRQALRVDLLPEALTAHHVAPRDVVDAIRQEHVLDTGGWIEEHGRELLISTDGRINDLQTLRAIIVHRGNDQRPVRLDQVAHVYAGALPQRYRVTVDGLPAVVFSIQKQPGASTLAVSHRVDQTLKTLTLPDNAGLEKFYDQAQIIGLAYRNMRTNLIIGAILAVLTLIWVLGHNRSSWIVAITLPMSVLGTLVLMDLFGLGLNLMTLAALTVAIGLIDDDAVIVLENIDRHRAAGKSPMEGVIAGLREIFTPDLAGTLTVLCAFVPLLFVSGLAGRLFRPFGMVFSFMLLLSFVLSVTLIPLASAHWLRPLGKDGSMRPTLGSRFVGLLGRLNGHLLGVLLHHRVVSIVLTVLLLAGSIALLMRNPVRFMPLLDEDALLVSYQLAPGTALGESSHFGSELESRILALPAVSAVFRRTGSPEESFFLEGSDQGELVVRLNKDTNTTPDQLRSQLENIIDQTPGVIGRVNEPTTEKMGESFSGMPALFGITVFASDLDVLHEAAGKIESAARKVKGVSNIVNNTKIPIDSLVVHINRSACASLGVRARTVADTVRVAMQGQHAATTLIDQKPRVFFVRYTDEARSSPEALAQVLVPTKSGRTIPLSQLATITRQRGYPTIEHQHGLRSLTMSANINGNPLAVMRALDAAIADLHLSSDIQTAYTGQYHQILVTGTQALWALLAAALLVFGVIAFQLGSALDATVVLLKLPIDFMGAAIALSIMHQPLDITLPLGLITLIGISVNNAIVLLTFTRRLRSEGLSAEQAVRQAVALRFRPMVLTHMTTLLALVPAAIGLGKGPQLLQPLGIMLFGGLTAGTLLTLNLLPVFYIATDRWRHTTHGSSD